MKRLPSLNGIRAISIVIVILSHFRIKYKLLVLYPLNFFFDGQLGVNIFFILSGYLIMKSLLTEEAQRGGISLKSFYRRRARRIFPAYYFLLIVYGILQCCGIIHLTFGSWFTSVFFLKYFNSHDIATGHLWTLSVEEQFYLFLPLFLVYARRYALQFSLLFILFVPLVRMGCYYFDYYPFGTDLSIFLRVDALATGCLFALEEKKISSLLDKVVKKVSASAGEIIILFGLLALFTVTGWNQKYNLHLSLILAAIGNTTGTIANFLVGLLLLLSINYRNGWYVLLNFSLMDYVGKLSYSLYLWQQLFVLALFAVPAFQGWGVCLAASLVAANFSYFVVERRFMRKGRDVEVSM